MSPRDLAERAVRKVKMDRPAVLYTILLTAQIKRRLDDGVSEADINTVVDWIGKLVERKDASPQLQNIFSWLSESNLPLILAAIREESDPLTSDTAWETMMRGLGAVTVPTITDEDEL